MRLADEADEEPTRQRLVVRHPTNQMPKIAIERPLLSSGLSLLNRHRNCPLHYWNRRKRPETGSRGRRLSAHQQPR
jgi:hypothetical protein